jgi:hypothetical protein
MEDRFYTNTAKTEAWMVTDKQTRYVRLIHKSQATGEEDYCLCTKTTSREDEAYIKGNAQVGDWDTFFHLLSQLLLTMDRKKKETEKFFKVEIQ